jgi:hypothetical protein
VVLTDEEWCLVLEALGSIVDLSGELEGVHDKIKAALSSQMDEGEIADLSSQME